MIEGIKAKLESGELDMEQILTRSFNEMEDMWRDTRRARMQQQYLEKHGFHWKPRDIDRLAEKRILERLKRKRFAADREEYSDDEEDAEEYERGDELMHEEVDVSEDEDEARMETEEEEED